VLALIPAAPSGSHNLCSLLMPAALTARSHPSHFLLARFFNPGLYLCHFCPSQSLHPEDGGRIDL